MRQLKIFLLSLWGLLLIPIGYLFELYDDKVLSMPEWLAIGIGALMFFLVWGWLAPALGLVSLLGITRFIYEVEIFPVPQNIWGWILPCICWYIIFNLIGLVMKKFKRKPT